MVATYVTLQACDVDAHIGYWKSDPQRPTAADTATLGPNAGHGMVVAGSDPAAWPAMGGSAPLATGIAGRSAPNNPTPDAGITQEPDACQLARDPRTRLEVTVVDSEAVLYNFADGAHFPAGRYRVAYVDGCRRYDAIGAWTLHASLLASGLSPQGRGGCYLVMSNGQALDLAPGTSGLLIGEGVEPAGAYATYAECVAANLKLPPLELSFAGGTLGIMNAGDSTTEKTRGEDVGGRSPTYRLTRLDNCL